MGDTRDIIAGFILLGQKKLSPRQHFFSDDTKGATISVPPGGTDLQCRLTDASHQWRIIFSLSLCTIKSRSALTKLIPATTPQ